jgi:DNA helicase-2/ATP-dependent DNA helicase PcrA
MTDFSSLLNPEQCEAVTAPGGPLLVLAAAGTGKTRTLVHRVAYLVENGVDPSSIMLLTFTNKAAREMIERARVTAPTATEITAGTFHSVCYRLLRLFGTKLGYSPKMSVIDDTDQKDIINQAIKSVVPAGDQKDFPKKSTILGWYSHCINHDEDVERYLKSLESKTSINPALVKSVIDFYIQRKKELEVLDFDDLLVKGLKLIKEFPDVKDYLQSRYRHILVDEYQDTNAIQAEFTDILAEKSRNLMVVGDDFQCIYTWRGAKFENIRRFPQRWPDCRIVKLERNYRSVPAILDMANTVMRDVPEEFFKSLRPVREDNGKLPKLFHVWDGYHQADVIMQLVSELRNIGYSYSDIAILYRSHYASIDIQMTLTKANIPFHITSGIGVFEQLHVKDLLAFLRLCVEDNAELAFMRVMGMLPGVGAASARKCWEKCEKSFCGTRAGDVERLAGFLPARAKAKWTELAEAFAGAAEELANSRAGCAVTVFLDRFYSKHLSNSFEEEDADSRIDDLKEVAAQIPDGSREGLEQFLSEVALMTNLDARKNKEIPDECLQLTTIHQAKGMEWPVVILPWLVNGIFPSQKAVEENNLDEERRLFYVALTRAKDRLLMLDAKMRKSPSGGLFGVDQSVFLTEVPKHLIEEKTIRKAFEPDSAFGGARRSSYGSGGYGSGGYGSGGYGGGFPRRGGGGTVTTTTTWRR